MPDAYTPNFNLTLPEVGSSRDTWGSKLNADLSIIDQYLGYAMPIGAVLDYAGGQAPPGWLICDGRLVSRVTYSTLFAYIGTYWGAGDGSTTFALPNPIGRASVGPGTIYDDYGNGLSLGFSQMLGELYYQIAQAHLPNYAIVTDVQGYHSHGGATAPGGNHTHSTDVQGYHSHTTSDAPHGHTVSDPSHNHYFNDYVTGGSGGYIAGLGSPSGYTTTATTGNYTGYSGTGISIGGGDHTHTTDTQGGHGHNISYSGNIQLGIYPDGSHQHTIYLGGSSAWFPVMQPMIVFTKIIYAGQQAAAAMMVAAATTIEGVVVEADEIASLREELAQLRAEIGFLRHPPNPRRLAAPLRGSH